MAETSDVSTSLKAVLDCPMIDNDVAAPTVRDYLKKLLLTVWEEGEGFSGKRPFGNSGWQYEVYGSLGKAGLVTCTFDEDGYVEECDDLAADRLILDAIQAI